MGAPPPLTPAGESVLSAFRGLPSRRASRQRPMVGLDSLIEVFLEKHRIGQPRLETILLEHWSEVLGASLAKRCTPIKIDPSGTLFIAVQDPSLRQELLFRKAAILRRLQDYAGPGRLRDLTFRAG